MPPAGDRCRERDGAAAPPSRRRPSARPPRSPRGTCHSARAAARSGWLAAARGAAPTPPLPCRACAGPRRDGGRRGRAVLVPPRPPRSPGHGDRRGRGRPCRAAWPRARARARRRRAARRSRIRRRRRRRRVRARRAGPRGRTGAAPGRLPRPDGRRAPARRGRWPRRGGRAPRAARPPAGLAGLAAPGRPAAAARAAGDATPASLGGRRWPGRPVPPP